MWKPRFLAKPDPEQVSQEFYDHLTKDVVSGEMLHNLRDEFPFIRPLMPARREQAYVQSSERSGIKRGTAVHAMGLLVLNSANLLENAGRQEIISPMMLKDLGSHAIAFGLLGAELHNSTNEAEALNLSANDMKQRIDHNYGEWTGLPLEQIITIGEADDSAVVTAEIATGGYDTLRAHLVQA